MQYLQTTFDGEKFGAATTLIGPFDDETFDLALAELNDKRRELLPGWKERAVAYGRK